MITLNTEKIKKLEEKLKIYEDKYKKKSKLWGQTERTRFGDSFEDQVRDDTNLLLAMINSIKEEIKKLKHG